MAGVDGMRRKTVLVTGSNRGFGRAIALRLARDGYDVVVHCRRDVARAEAVAEEARALGARALVEAADLEDPAAIDRLFDRVAAEYGRLDAFVANAAATAFLPTLAMKPHHIDRTFGLNVRGFVLSVQRAVALMPEEGGGRIVAISGYGSIRYLPGYAAMGAAKAALERWVSYLAVELAPRGIAVNGINPGCAETASAEVYFTRAGSEPQAEVARRTPMGRLTRAEDVAGVAAFLLSDDAAFICGQTIVVDGGLTLVVPPFADSGTLEDAAWGRRPRRAEAALASSEAP
jgi:enoyl-[acyl-carrier protein] reductase III